MKHFTIGLLGALFCAGSLPARPATLPMEVFGKHASIEVSINGRTAPFFAALDLLNAAGQRRKVSLTLRDLL